MAENSVIEQLRLQEGRLFQNEKTLALYLDVKAVVFEAIVSATRSEERATAFTQLEAFTGEDSDNRILKSFLKLAPSGMNEYHSKSLHECVKIVANLLWPTELLLVARPKVPMLLGGVLKRLASQTIVSTGQFLDLDPIKQDFLIREAFRRCLVNDCLVVFEETTAVETLAEAPEEADSDKSKELEEEVGPDDSASHIGSVTDERPAGARSVVAARPSVLPTLDEDETKSVKGSVVRSVVRSVARSIKETDDVRSVVGSLKMGSVVGSVAPRVITVNDSASTSSKASGITATSIMRRALNVRKVHIEPDV